MGSMQAMVDVGHLSGESASTKVHGRGSFTDFSEAYGQVS